VFRPMLNLFSSTACLDAVLTEDDDKVACASPFFVIRLYHLCNYTSSDNCAIIRISQSGII